MSENLSPDIEKLLSDPNVLSSIAEAVRSINTVSPNSEKMSETPNPSAVLPQASLEASEPADAVIPQTVLPNGNDDIISSMLSNPEIISKLPQIVAAAKPIIQSIQGMPKNENSKTESAIGSEKTDASPHTMLLKALRPYLSEQRRDALDGIVKIAGLMEVMKMLDPPKRK